MLEIQRISDRAADMESWRVDPYQITNYSRTLEQLQSFFCFCPAVAGKTASIIALMLHKFFSESDYSGTPFEQIKAMIANDTLVVNLKRSHIGKYTLLEKCFNQAVNDTSLDLRTVTTEHLERFNGFGMKSSRFFILHSQPNTRIAVIDTHILKYLRAIGVDRVPDKIPTGKEYLRLEQIIIDQASKLELEPQDFDLQVWSWYAKGNKGIPEFKAIIHPQLLIV